MKVYARQFINDYSLIQRHSVSLSLTGTRQSQLTRHRVTRQAGFGFAYLTLTVIVSVIVVSRSAPNPQSREVKLICLPSDNMRDRGHIEMIIYIYYAIPTDNW